MKYIKTFDHHSDYEAYMNSENIILPNLSVCKDLLDAHVTPEPDIYDYSQDYFTIEMLESGNLSFYTEKTLTLYYSLNDGETWQTYTYQSLNNRQAGDKILFKCTLTQEPGPYASAQIQSSEHIYKAADPEAENWFGKFSSSAHHIVYGNILSLIYGDNFINTDNLNLSQIFTELFSNNAGLTSAKNLILPTTVTTTCYSGMFYYCTSLTEAPVLPATTLVNGCYRYMFYYCTSLVKAPVLPATTLVNNCYNNMFYGCTSLNYIKAMFTTTPSNSYTSNWVYNVSATGTFVKSSEASWNVTGVHGVPTGWTIETT